MSFSLVSEWTSCFITPVLQGIADFFSMIWNGISTVIQSVWNFITQYLQAIWTAILYFATRYLKVLRISFLNAGIRLNLLQALYGKRLRIS